MKSFVDSLAMAFAHATPLVACDARSALDPTLTRYFAAEQERVDSHHLPMAVLSVPLEGHQELWIGDGCERFGPGEVFAAPAYAPFHLVNVPDRRSGRYASIVFGCPAHLVGPEHDEPLDYADAARPSRVHLDAAICEALVRTALVLADKGEARAIAELRMREVLLLMRRDPAVRAMFQRDRAAQVANVVRGDLARKWTVAEVARALNVASSTLRRQLAAQATSFRVILQTERMALAERMLATSGMRVNEVAEAAGYASRAHFVVRFREQFGRTPSCQSRRLAPREPGDSEGCYLP